MLAQPFTSTWSKGTRAYRVYSDQWRLAKLPFYRDHPDMAFVARRGLDRKGLIDFENGFFFNRIAKSANSTVAINLAKVFLGRDLVSRDAKAAFMRPSQLRQSQLANFDRLFKFAVVRNPYSRVLSAYLDKIVSLDCHYDIRRAGRLPSFAEFCRYLAADGLMRNVHWTPQRRLLLLPPERFDFFGKVENLNEDWAAIVQRIAPGRAAAPLERHGEGVTNASSRIDEHYDDETRAIVARLYRDDFLSFGYDI